jgi:hypothetical protein
MAKPNPNDDWKNAPPPQTWNGVINEVHLENFTYSIDPVEYMENSSLFAPTDKIIHVEFKVIMNVVGFRGRRGEFMNVNVDIPVKMVSKE